MIVLYSIIECPSCGVEFDGVWDDVADTVQDLTEAPMAEQECPSCGNRSWEQYPAWVNYTEAG